MPTSGCVAGVRAAEHRGQLADVAGADVPGPGLQRHDERQLLGRHPLGQQAHLRVPEHHRRHHPEGHHVAAAATVAGTGAAAASPGPPRRRTAARAHLLRPDPEQAAGARRRPPPRPARRGSSRPAAHPTGAASAPLAAIRDHNAGISPGAAAPGPPPRTPPARPPRRPRSHRRPHTPMPAKAAPATPPMTPAARTQPFRSASVPGSAAAIPKTYRLASPPGAPACAGDKCCWRMQAMQAMQKPVNRKAPLVPVRCKSAGALLHSDGQREVCDRCTQRFAQRRCGTRAQPAIRPLPTSARRWCRWPAATLRSACSAPSSTNSRPSPYPDPEFSNPTPAKPRHVTPDSPVRFIAFRGRPFGTPDLAACIGRIQSVVATPRSGGG